jgi:hypothetical protein
MRLPTGAVRLGLGGLAISAALLSSSALAFAAPTISVGVGGGPELGQQTPLSHSLLASGGFTVACSQLIPTTGGTTSCKGGASTFTVNVPAADARSALQVVLSYGANVKQLACNIGAVTVSFFKAGTEQKVDGEFSAPVQMTIANSAITTKSKVLALAAATQTWVAPALSTNVVNGTATAGLATFRVVGDATMIAQSTICSQAIAGATTALTGKPILGESVLGGTLVLGGLFALALLLRRRRLEGLGATRASD